MWYLGVPFDKREMNDTGDIFSMDQSMTYFSLKSIHFNSFIENTMKVCGLKHTTSLLKSTDDSVICTMSNNITVDQLRGRECGHLLES